MVMDEWKEQMDNVNKDITCRKYTSQLCKDNAEWRICFIVVSGEDDNCLLFTVSAQ